MGHTPRHGVRSVLLGLLVTTTVAAPNAASSPAPATLTGIEILNFGLHDPSSMGVDGPDLFIAEGASVVEVAAVGGKPLGVGRAPWPGWGYGTSLTSWAPAR